MADERRSRPRTFGAAGEPASRQDGIDAASAEPSPPSGPAASAAVSRPIDRLIEAAEARAVRGAELAAARLNAGVRHSGAYASRASVGGAGQVPLYAPTYKPQSAANLTHPASDLHLRPSADMPGSGHEAEHGRPQERLQVPISSPPPAEVPGTILVYRGYEGFAPSAALPFAETAVNGDGYGASAGYGAPATETGTGTVASPVGREWPASAGEDRPRPDEAGFGRGHHAEAAAAGSRGSIAHPELPGMAGAAPGTIRAYAGSVRPPNPGDAAAIAPVFGGYGPTPGNPLGGDTTAGHRTGEWISVREAGGIVPLPPDLQPPIRYPATEVGRADGYGGISPSARASSDPAVGTGLSRLSEEARFRDMLAEIIRVDALRHGYNLKER